VVAAAHWQARQRELDVPFGPNNTRATPTGADMPKKKRKQEEDPKPPIPAWAWIFAVACGIIPVLTLGGAIPGAIGFGGAAGCVGVARGESMPLAGRIAACVAITVGCWVLVGTLLGGFALLMNR
jgi:hypothetical protein